MPICFVVHLFITIVNDGSLSMLLSDLQCWSLYKVLLIIIIICVTVLVE